MQRLLLLAVAILLPASVAAQNWTFDDSFPPSDFTPTTSNGAYDGHGVAVDPDGKIWLQYYYPTDSTQVPEFMANDPAGRNGYRDIRVTYVFNPDGSQASFSPLKYVVYPGGDRDTLGGFLRRDAANALIWEGNSNRGLRADPTGASLGGDVLISVFDFLYRVNYQTGAGVAGTRIEPFCASTQAASDNLGNVYLAPVCPGQPIVRMSGSDLSIQENVVDATASGAFARTVNVSPDGLTVFESSYEKNYTVLRQRPDEFTAFDSTGITLRGMRTESTTFQPGTGWFWASAGGYLSPNLDPNQDPEVVTNWSPLTWYAFEMSDVMANQVPTPLDSLKWDNPDLTDGGTAPRARGLAFTPNGQTAYIAEFGDADIVPFQKLNRTSNPAVEAGAIPGIATLNPNAPNPASSATEIRFTLAKAAEARVRIYDVAGRELMTVLNEALPAGDYARTVTLNDLPAGTYVYTLEVEGRTTSRRMLVVR